MQHKNPADLVPGLTSPAGPCAPPCASPAATCPEDPCERVYFPFSQDKDGLVPGPTSSEVSQAFILGADGKWGPRAGFGLDSVARSMATSVGIVESADFSVASSENLSQSVLLSTTDSKLDSAVLAGGADSAARSAISSAVLVESIDASASLSRDISQSTLISDAASTAASAGAAAAAPANDSVARSAVSSAVLLGSAASSVAESENLSQSILISAAQSSASVPANDSVARSGVSSAVLLGSGANSVAESNNLSQSILISAAQSTANAAGGAGVDSVARSGVSSAVLLGSGASSVATSQDISQSILISAAQSTATAAGGAATDSTARSMATSVAVVEASDNLSQSVLISVNGSQNTSQSVLISVAQSTASASGTGTVNAGAIGQMAYYAAAGSVVSGSPIAILTGSGLTITGSIGATQNLAITQQATFGNTSTDYAGQGVVFIKGATKGVRIYTIPTGTQIEGVDSATGVTSYQPLAFGGSSLFWQINGATVATMDATSFNVVGFVRAQDAGGTKKLSIIVTGGVCYFGTQTNDDFTIIRNGAAIGTFNASGLDGCAIGQVAPAAGRFTTLIGTVSVGVAGGPVIVPTGIQMYGGGSVTPPYIYDNGGDSLSFRFGPSSGYSYVTFGPSVVNFDENVGVTGDFTVTGFGHFGTNIEAGSSLGVAKTGTGISGYAEWSNKAVFGTTAYGLLQSSAGLTILNSAAGQSLYLRNNNADIAVVSSTGVAVTGNVTATGAIAASNYLLTSSYLYFVGANNTHPLLRSSGADLEVVLGDQSSYANFRASNLIAVGGISAAGTITAGGSVTALGVICNPGALFQSLGGGTIGNSSMATTGGTLGNAELQSNGTGGAWIAYHRVGSFAAYMGLDTDNRFKVGGWSMGAAAYPIALVGITNAGELFMTGNVTAYYSDDRLKTRFENIANALAKVCSLDGFYYEANEVAQKLGYKPVREVGLSAQSVQKVLPEVVAPAPVDSQYLTLRYEKIVPLLVEAIKELKNELDSLRSQLLP
jgi:Chaperone of endosialidase